MHLPPPRVIWFLAVGCMAALTHLGVVMALVSYSGLAPLVANIIGWLIAFCVSFGGHYSATFRDQNAPKLRSSMRFFVISAAGFAINECAYAVLLHGNWLPYDAALAVILLAVSSITYLLSRHWAFRGTEAR